MKKLRGMPVEFVNIRVYWVDQLDVLVSKDFNDVIDAKLHMNRLGVPSRAYEVHAGLRYESNG